jgi:GTP-binding protein HflX
LPETQRTELSVRQETAILVGVVLPGDDYGGEEPLSELERLATTAGAKVVDCILQKRGSIDPRTYIGPGKAEELHELVEEHDASAVLCDHDLSPAQIRNLEEAVGTKVVDRSELILDIFATRAKTRQAKVQVELAQMEYTFPRLTNMWTHLDRHGGGIGTRGPGERQLESDRRAHLRRIADLKRELDHIAERKHREVAARQGQFSVSMVGYTNAGKTTLLRALTGAKAFVEDRLFATLDTKTRVWELDSSHRVLLSDTVGFIRRLPHHLVASFHATLEEATEADLLLHVIDISHPDCFHQAETAGRVLGEIGCGETPVLPVFNKIDAAEETPEAELLRASLGGSACGPPVRLSALRGEGLDALRDRVMEFVSRRESRVTVSADCRNGKLLARVHEAGRVLHTEQADERMVIEARIEPSRLGALHAVAGPGDIITVHDPPSPRAAAEGA